MNEEIQTELPEKVYEVSFSFRETAKGIAAGTSIEHVTEGIVNRYGQFPDFRIEAITELDISLDEAIQQSIKELTSDDSDNPPTVN